MSDLCKATSMHILESENRLQGFSDHAFDAVDRNSDGLIDHKDLKKCFEAITEDLEVKMPSKKDLDRVMDELDRDGDKRLNRQEFKELMRIWLRMKLHK